ncbi:helix-turn-helix transcriptional regulator [Saccharothrix xinjiangensis]|uniref:Helix-turn-helix transcriptional regulator n=1 Tax=Saccharothrix xinjiangensis TaxID=204798 RepID=A0ABV9Y952_9PSEU
MDRAELAAFLRSRRSRVNPADLGLDTAGRRRTPGLRREEAARLAGISADYYVRLEQGRGPRPSSQVLYSLARALRLSDDERTYLLRLVGAAPVQAASTPVSRLVPEGILRLLDRLEEIPAIVVDVKYDILAWNRMATAVMRDFGAMPERSRNTLRWLFLQDPTWMSDPDRWQFPRECVADLRASGRYADDPAVRGFVDEMCLLSEEFASLWADHEIVVQRSTRKRSEHPLVGELELDCEVVLVPERDQRLLLYTAAPGSPAADALRFLRNTVATGS